MKMIWKFTIPPLLQFELQMPEGAEILCIQAQGNCPQIWTLVEKERPLETRHFICLGTGVKWSGGIANYVGTVQLHSGALVYHFFEFKHPGKETENETDNSREAHTTNEAGAGGDSEHAAKPPEPGRPERV